MLGYSFYHIMLYVWANKGPEHNVAPLAGMLAPDRARNLGRKYIYLWYKWLNEIQLSTPHRRTLLCMNKTKAHANEKNKCVNVFHGSIAFSQK